VGIAFTIASILTPPNIRTVLLPRGFNLWFGAMFLYFTSSFFLTAWANFTRRDFVGAGWMCLVTIAFAAVGFHFLREGFA
jgi:hypothetical protein